MVLGLLFTFFLVFLNGFFVAAEFAIVKVRTSQVEVRKGASPTMIGLAKNMLANLDGYLAATQLGITLASLGLGWVSESVFTELILHLFAWLDLSIAPNLARSISIPVAFLLITILHIVFGELAPKSLAIRKPTQVTFAVAVPMQVFHFIFRPFIWLLNGFANFVLKLMGLDPVSEHEEVHSEEELKVIIEESHKGGVLEETEKSLIQNVFNLGDRSVLSLMTPRNEVVWLNLNDGWEKNKAKVLLDKHNVYPVCRGDLDNIIGYAYSKDLIGNDFDEKLRRLEQIARKMLVAVTSNKAYSVLERFQQEKIYQAVVVDEFGSVRGFVTINDIVDALVGNISDTDEFEYSIVKLSNNWLSVDAQIPFVEFIERVMPKYADENFSNFTTLGGYIINQVARLPQKGDKVQWHQLLFEVDEMDNNRIDKVIVKEVEGE